MPTLEIKSQPKMSLPRLVDLTVTAIRYRLFRSFMTFMVITVAIAFLMNISAGSLIERSVQQGVSDRVEERRMAITWVSRITQPVSVQEVVEAVAETPFSEPRGRELASFGGLDEEGYAELRQHARRIVADLQFFRNLEYGTRRELVGAEVDIALFDRLASDEEATETLIEELENLRTARLPGGLEAFRETLEQWPATRAKAETLRDRSNAAVARLSEYLDEERALMAFTRLDEGFRGVLEEAGFVLDDAVAETIQRQAIDAIRRERLHRAFQQSDVRSALAGRLNVDPADVDPDLFWDFVDREENAAWFLARYEASVAAPPEAWTPGELRRLADAYHTDQRLNGALSRAGAMGQSFFGLSERLAWLVLVSLMVCAVGIANAMLMSVAERYREIATLKCLGALDGSILWIFVLEASMLGLAGGVCGATLGLLIAVGRMIGGYGALAFTDFPGVTLLLLWVLATIVGALLAAVASIYPSWKAARLPPMEAMRIE